MKDRLLGRDRQTDIQSHGQREADRQKDRQRQILGQAGRQTDNRRTDRLGEGEGWGTEGDALRFLEKEKE